MIKRYKITEFINKSFRDVADCDYINARSCYKIDLIDQFLWSSLQSIEKYLKAIILYHDGNTKTINHNLNKAVKLIEVIPKIDWSFISPLKNYFAYLTDYGCDRYFIKPSGTQGTELLNLDHAVWTIRRYCQDFQLIEFDTKNNFNFDEYLEHLSSDKLRKKPHTFSLFYPGYLELVLKSNNNSELRSILIWKNSYYGLYKKHRFNFKQRLSGKTPSHYSFPDIFNWVDKRVILPNSVEKYFSDNKDCQPKYSGILRY